MRTWDGFGDVASVSVWCRGETLVRNFHASAWCGGRREMMMIGARSHHELVVVFQQEGPLGCVQGRGDLLRGDCEVLGDLLEHGGRVSWSSAP